jgi:hypothetical protein
MLGSPLSTVVIMLSNFSNYCLLSTGMGVDARMLVWLAELFGMKTSEIS